MFVEGHTMAISAKLFQFWWFLKFFLPNKLRLLVDMFLDGLNSF